MKPIPIAYDGRFYAAPRTVECRIAASTVERQTESWYSKRSGSRSSWASNSPRTVLDLFAFAGTTSVEDREKIDELAW